MKEAPPPRRGWRTPAAVAAVAVAVLVPLGISRLLRDTPDEPPALASRLWRADHGGAPHVVYVTRQRRIRALVVRGRSRSLRHDPYTRFTLVVRRVPEGALVKSVVLGDYENVGIGNGPEILGVVGDVVWTWRDSLEARRLPALAVHATAATLAARGGASPELLPTEPDGYRVRPDRPALVARGRDARYYTIDGAARTVAPLDPATLPATWDVARSDDRFDRLQPPNRSLAYTRPGNMTQRAFLTSTGLWYALLSESERATLSRWPSAGLHPSGEVARTLHHAPYRLDDRRTPEIDPARVQALGGERLIEAGFLERGPQRVWDVADPSSTLVLAHALVGARAPWDVVRLARDGRVLWRTSTELAEPRELLDLGSHVALLGHEIGPRTAAGRVPRDRLVWIDERTGARRSLSIATGEVE